MLSRVADAIYWMARYIERAENLARFIDVTLNLELDQPLEKGTNWEPLVRVTGDNDLFAERYGEATKDNVICFLTFDREYPNSIISALTAARENARTVREVISSETWEHVNEFYHLVRDASFNDSAVRAPSEFFDQVKRCGHLFNGVTDATMSHGVGWNFLNVGRMLERADKTSRILDVKYFTLLPKITDVGTMIDDLQWSAVLRSVSGFEMYRKRYRLLTIERVVEFLLLDRAFPRAVQWCLIEADKSLHAITGTPQGAFSNAAEQQCGRLRSYLAYTAVRDIIQQGMHEFIDFLQTQINEVGDAIFETYFAMRQMD
jgi:uncharacterized alpha-E superfamily protein